MLVRIQWILIALLVLSTAAMALWGRQSAYMARAQAERAMAEARDRMAMLEELRRNEPVEQIIVEVGDELSVRSDHVASLNQSTSVQRDGHALFREVGWIDVAGKSRPEVEVLLSEAYGSLYQEAGVVYVIVKSRK